jgi:hypothetical protein
MAADKAVHVIDATNRKRLAHYSPAFGGAIPGIGGCCACFSEIGAGIKPTGARQSIPIRALLRLPLATLSRVALGSQFPCSVSP